MKRLLFAAALLLFATPAHTEEMATCEDMANLIAQIADAHQKGVPLSKILEATGASKLQPVILDIYRAPRYSSTEMQEREIEWWRNAFHIGCLDAHREARQ
jgi:hypothetical protein